MMIGLTKLRNPSSCVWSCALHSLVHMFGVPRKEELPRKWLHTNLYLYMYSFNLKGGVHEL